MNTEIEDVELERVMNIIGIKNREPVPLRSLRIVLVRPTNIKKKGQEMLGLVNYMFDLMKVESWELIRKQIEDKSEIGKYSHVMSKQGQRVPDDIMSLLVYNELSHIKSKHNGFILEGFPKTTD